MIRYENAGSRELVDTIEKLCSEDRDLDDYPREEVVVIDVRGDLIVSYFSLAGHGNCWVVFVGRYANRGPAKDYRFRGRDMNVEIEKLGYTNRGLRWIYANLYGIYTLPEEKEWLIDKLRIPLQEYHDNLWTRKLAVEHALTRI